MNVYDIDSVDIDGTFLDKDSVIECGPSEESCMKNCTSENVEMKMARRSNKGSGSKNSSDESTGTIKRQRTGSNDSVEESTGVTKRHCLFFCHRIKKELITDDKVLYLTTSCDGIVDHVIEGRFIVRVKFQGGGGIYYANKRIENLRFVQQDNCHVKHTLECR